MADDLDDILYSALAEIEKQSHPTPAANTAPASSASTSSAASSSTTGASSTTSTTTSTTATTTTTSSSSSSTSSATNASATDEDEILESALAEVTKKMRELVQEMSGSDEQLAKSLLEMAAGDGERDEAGIKEGLSKTLQMLYDTTEQLSQMNDGNKEALEETAWNKLLDQLEGSPEFGGVMEGVLKQLLCKDIIQEPLERMKEKYPIWLEQNKSNLSAEDLERYTKQYGHITQLCELFEKDPENFQAIVACFQEVQECGQAPPDIIKDLAPGVEFNPDGTPKFPDADAQCSIM